MKKFICHILNLKPFKITVYTKKLTAVKIHFINFKCITSGLEKNYLTLILNSILSPVLPSILSIIHLSVPSLSSPLHSNLSSPRYVILYRVSQVKV